MKIQFFMKNGPRIHEKSFSTQKAIKRSSFCSIFNENRMKIIFWLQILALTALNTVAELTGYHTAFMAGAQIKVQPHRTELPEPPRRWKDLENHPHAHGFKH